MSTFPSFLPGLVVGPSGRDNARYGVRGSTSEVGLVRSRPDYSRHAWDRMMLASYNFTVKAIQCNALEMPLSSFLTLSVGLSPIAAVDVSPERSYLQFLNYCCHLSLCCA